MARVKVPKPVTIDFETHKIMPRPLYPPMPVGVSIKYPGKKAKYYAFGHLEGNNCTWSEAEKALRDAYDHSDGILFQNGKFDLDVAEHILVLRFQSGIRFTIRCSSSTYIIHTRRS